MIFHGKVGIFGCRLFSYLCSRLASEGTALKGMHRGADRIGDVYIARDYSAIWEAQEKVMGEVLKAADAEKVPLKVANL